MNANLVRARFESSEIQGSNMTRVDARLANFNSASLTGVNLSGARLERASFRSAELAGVVFAGAALGGADFRDADMAGANLRARSLRRRGLTQTRFDEACTDSSTRLPQGLAGHACHGTMIVRRRMPVPPTPPTPPAMAGRAPPAPAARPLHRPPPLRAIGRRTRPATEGGAASGTVLLNSPLDTGRRSLVTVRIK